MTTHLFRASQKQVLRGTCCMTDYTLIQGISKTGIFNILKKRYSLKGAFCTVQVYPCHCDLLGLVVDLYLGGFVLSTCFTLHKKYPCISRHVDKILNIPVSDGANRNGG